jgi:phosphoribosylglycinamide formyltransferase 1
LRAGVKLHGATVHYVSDGVDEGRIIAQAGVAVRPDDDSTTLAARVLEAEHQLFPLALSLAVTGAASEVRGFGPPAGAPALINGWLDEAAHTARTNP